MEIHFYETAGGAVPAKEFIDKLTVKQKLKVAWQLKIIQEEGRNLHTKYFKKLSPSDIWEIRVQMGGINIRLLGFFDGNEFLILNHGFIKKTQNIPKKELDLAIERCSDYKERKK